MTDEHNDPTPVMKFVAGMILLFTTVGLVALAIFKGREFNMWIVTAAAIPSIASLIMMSDKIRDAVLSIASALPFVKYKTPDGK
jgi:hypothetical protein